MTDCVICFESPCRCVTAPARTPSATPSRSIKESQPRRVVNRFTTVVKPDIIEESEPENFQSMHSQVYPDDSDRSNEELIRILAPLLSEGELANYREYLPADCQLSLNERVHKFRSKVQWSESRYNG